MTDERLESRFKGFDDELARQGQQLAQQGQQLAQQGQLLTELSQQVMQHGQLLAQLSQQVTHQGHQLVVLIESVSQSLGREIHNLGDRLERRIDAIDIRLNLHGGKIRSYDQRDVATRTWLSRMDKWSEDIGRVVSELEKRVSELEKNKPPTQ